MHYSGNIPPGLLEALRTFPVERAVKHCGVDFIVDPLSIYANCPACGQQVKLRCFSAGDEIEDVFDAVLEWMLKPGAADVVKRRMEIIAQDRDDE